MLIIEIERFLKGACNEQAAIVRREWPDGIPITLASASRAVELSVDIDWAAERLLTATALAEYERVKATAWAECRVTATALAEYERVTATALVSLLIAGGGKSAVVRSSTRMPLHSNG